MDSSCIPLIDQFKTEVSDKATEIDPDNEYCWKSLTYGWYLAKGYKPEKALEIAITIRYKTELA